jgi:hypothetical protein
MSVTVLQQHLYTRVVEILKAWAALYDNADRDKVRSATLIRRDTANDQPEKPVNRNFGDLPELTVLWGPAKYKSWDQARYAFSSGTKPTGTAKELTQGFRITLTHSGLKAEKNDPLVAAVIDALDNAGPGLGLVPSVVPYAVRGEIGIDTATGNVTRPISGKGDGISREQITLTFDVVMRWKGEPLPTVTA